MKRKDILVSIILPSYNCEIYISETIASIVNQAYSNLEIIIIDDASTDNTCDIIQSFKDDRIKLIKKPVNTGYTDSLNMGLEIATGKYIARMDADDIAHPERIEKQLAFMEANPDVVLCGTWINLIPSGKLHTYPIQHEAIVAQLLRINAFCHPSIMMRKSVIDEHNLRYDKSYEPTEDYELWTRLALLGRVHNIPEPLLQYRLHEQQVSSVKNEIQKANLKAVRNKFIKKISNTIDEDIFETDISVENGNEGVKYLINKYQKLDELKRYSNSVIPVLSIREFIRYQKKEIIRDLSKRINKTKLNTILYLLITRPEALRILGIKHSITFTGRAIVNTFWRGNK